MRIAAAILLAVAIPVSAGAAAPELALSVNASTSAAILGGWPLLVEVLIANPSEQEPLTLSPRGIAWPRAVRLLATAPDGREEPLAYELTAEPPAGFLTLPPASSTRFVILVPEAATTSLAAGRHRLTARLEIRDSSGWNGAVDATAWIEVSSADERDAAQRLTGATLRATAFALRGRYTEARSVLREHLKAEPDAGPALQLMAEILEREGDTGGAYLFAARAAALSAPERKAYSRESEPPVRLFQLQQRLLAKIQPQVSGAPAPNAPARSPSSGGAAAGGGSSKPASQPALQPTAPPKPAPAGGAAPAASAAPAVPGSDPKAAALKQYAETLAKGDALVAAGDYFEAVRVFEQAWRIRYNNKLDVPITELDDRLAKARKARDEKKKL